MTIFTKAFWSYAGERAVKTVAQTAISLLTVAGIAGVLDVAWVPLVSAVALAGVISILTSLTAYAPAGVVVSADGVVSTGVLPTNTTPGE